MIENLFAGYVNLDSRKDRHLHMQHQLKKYGLADLTPINRFRGVLPGEYKGPPEKVKVMKDRTPGAIGCYLAQMNVMEAALVEKKHALVMEDDLVFCDDLVKRLQYIDEFTENNPWDIIWLGATVHVNPPVWHKELGKDAQRTSDPRMLQTYGCFCTYAYIVNVEAVQSILDRLDAIMIRSIGIDWSMIQMQPDLQTFCFVPGCVKQMDNKSNIGNGYTHFSGFSKLNGTVDNSKYWWQRKMEDFNPETFNWAEAK